MADEDVVLVKIHLLMLLLLWTVCAAAQTVGGAAAYNFLKLPASPLLTATGGANVSYTGGDVSLTANNPALLTKKVSGEVNAGFHSFLAGTKGYSLTAAFHADKRQVTFGSHVHFIDYGSLPNTDAAGNVFGNFRPVDFVVQVSAAGRYLQRWSYGATLKYIHSSYGIFQSRALAADVGVLYQDTAKLLAASLVVKNMGVPIKTYAGGGEELPFDLQVGLTQRLQKAPFGFSVTAQHLQNFSILYTDTSFNRDNNFSSSTNFFNNLVTHFVLASHLYLGPNLEAHLGYNILRREELSISREGNGLTGFSAGVTIRLNKLQVQYARSAYQKGVASNQIGLTLNLPRFLGNGL